jgi:choline-sulfatase
VRGERWRKISVDLSTLAGEVIRLDLASSGSGLAAWGEPEIVWTPATEPAVPALSASPPRVLVQIVVDAARQDVYQPFNPRSEVQTPTFSRLAESSILFAHAYSNGNFTVPSVATILSGRYAATFMGSAISSRIPDDIPLLPEHLRRHGFRTALFTANPALSEAQGFARGWDFILHSPPPRFDAATLFGPALDFIKLNAHDRLYLYIQTMEPHDPYRVHPEVGRSYYHGTYHGTLGPVVQAELFEKVRRQRRIATEEDKAYVRSLYAQAVHAHDLQLGRFVTGLEKLGVLKETILLHSNDHGEELFDHDSIGHGHTLYEELLRSPLLLHAPGLFPARRVVEEIVEHVDLAATILELLRVPALAGMHGASLVGLIAGRPALRPAYALSDHEGIALRVGRLKLVRTELEDHLYDLATDPGEGRDLAGSAWLSLRTCEIYLREGTREPAKAKRLSSTEHASRNTRDEQAEIGPELRRQLEALGYIVPKGAPAVRPAAPDAAASPPQPPGRR